MKKHETNTALPIRILKGVGVWALAELVLMSLSAALVLGTGVGQDWIRNSSYAVHAVSVFIASVWTAGKQKEGKMITTMAVGASVLLILLLINLTGMRDGIRGIVPVVSSTAAAAAAAALLSGKKGSKRSRAPGRGRK